MSPDEFAMPEVVRTRDFAAAVAGAIALRIREVLAAREFCWIALCGGNTPRPVYATLAGHQLPWDRVRFTFGDERCVPPDDPASNFLMAKRALFDPADIDPDGILRFRGEIDPVAAAAEVERRLRDEAAARGEPLFHHDMILLGMGADGHTASLFPGTSALSEMALWAVANPVPQLDTTRLTLTYPIFNAAREVWFLVDDAAKEPMVGAILQGHADVPAAKIRPDKGRVIWWLGPGDAKRSKPAR